jgi:hypothetical protein
MTSVHTNAERKVSATVATTDQRTTFADTVLSFARRTSCGMRMPLTLALDLVRALNTVALRWRELRPNHVVLAAGGGTASLGFDRLHGLVRDLWLSRIE